MNARIRSICSYGPRRRLVSCSTSTSFLTRGWFGTREHRIVVFMKTIAARMDVKNVTLGKILDDSDVRDFLADVYVRKVYVRLREAAR